MRSQKPLLTAMVFVAACCASLFAVAARGASITLESAQLGPIGQTGGQSLSTNQFIGWRFHTTKSLSVQEVGGHLLGSTGTLFAAIVSLSDSTALPLGAPFNDSEVVAKKVFTPPASSADYFTPLAAQLSPGDYALIFGSGRFDAVGAGAIVNHPTNQPNVAPTTQASYIVWRQTLPGKFKWTAGSVNNVRLAIHGAEVAGPADFNGDVAINGGDLAAWKTGFGALANATRETGDADLDGDVDGADFLAWQRGASFTAATGTVAEPASGVMALIATLLTAHLARRRP